MRKVCLYCRFKSEGSSEACLTCDFHLRGKEIERLKKGSEENAEIKKILDDYCSGGCLDDIRCRESDCDMYINDKCNCLYRGIRELINYVV